jgi:hypothetical protein
MKASWRKAAQQQSMQIAETIIKQLGGREFIALTGSKQLVALASGVQFSIGTGAKDGINKCRITLDPSDTYTVEFFRFNGIEAKTISIHDDVYNDSLQDVFERATGFYVTLRARS